jgi:hypothetical protein
VAKGSDVGVADGDSVDGLTVGKDKRFWRDGGVTVDRALVIVIREGRGVKRIADNIAAERAGEPKLWPWADGASRARLLYKETGGRRGDGRPRAVPLATLTAR